MNRRLPIIVLLVFALVATGFTRQLASSHRNTQRTFGGEETNAGPSPQLSRMNSFALALLLGGLRGPLVMILWTSSETQKTDKNLQDFDTKVEWIRLLQPEFDSVHIFQMWNKAYNISVQMASLANKYLTIIDAIDYGQRVDRERPNNINIIYQIGSIYGDKLGDSQEKVYYGRRVRQDSRPHASRQKLAASDPGYRRLELDPVLDENGKMLDKYVTPPGKVRLVDPENPDDVYDGSELGYLKRFEPYPYGVGPYGFAYSYRKRAQLLQRLGHQKHAQLSDLVVDSRPALDLKKWGEAEWEHGRRLEIRAAGKKVPTERRDMEGLTADLTPTFVSDATSSEREALMREAAFSYGLAQRLWKAADVEYVNHLKRFKTNISTYQSHRDEMVAEQALMRADEAYTKAMLAPAQDRAPLLAEAREAYRKAIVVYSLIILRYYVQDQFPEIVAQTYPSGMTPASVPGMLAKPEGIEPNQIFDVVRRSAQLIETRGQQLPDEIYEYMAYIRRCDIRLKQMPQ